MTKDELLEAGVTREIALAWEAFYVDVKRRNPENPSAEGRAELMHLAATLLAESEAK